MLLTITLSPAPAVRFMLFPAVSDMSFVVAVISTSPRVLVITTSLALLVTDATAGEVIVTAVFPVIVTAPVVEVIFTAPTEVKPIVVLVSMVVANWEVIVTAPLVLVSVIAPTEVKPIVVLASMVVANWEVKARSSVVEWMLMFPPVASKLISPPDVMFVLPVVVSILTSASASNTILPTEADNPTSVFPLIAIAPFVGSVA